MAKTKHPPRRAAPAPPRRAHRRLVALVVLAAAAALTFLLIPRASTRDSGGAAGQAATAPPGTPPDPQAVVGRWVRTDHPYVVEIRGVSPDGKLDVRYLNPRPINVSYARTEPRDGRMGITIELNDQGYAGSLYSLTYEPDADRLVGTYRLPTRNEEFAVSFSRQARD